MKISTIIRTYNRGYVVGEAIESALRQTHQNIEIIVVDDGSTDDTWRVVNAFRSPKVRYLRHDGNRGVAVAANTGIRAASGDVIALLDSDDLWKAEKLERQVDFLQRHPTVDVLFSDVEIVDGGERLPSTMQFMRCFPELLDTKGWADEYVIESRAMYLCLLEEVPIKTNSVAIRRRAFDLAGQFDHTSKSGEDWELFLRMSRSVRFGYIRQPLAIQRRSHDSTHLRYRIQDKTFLLEKFLQEKHHIAGDRDALLAVNRGIGNHCSNLAYDYLHSGQRKKALGVYLRGFKETRDRVFLFRAAGALLPLAIRGVAKALARRLQVT